MKKRFVNDMDRELYTVLDPQYGYLNDFGEPTMLDEGLGQGITHGHDMENAVFFDADDAYDLVNSWAIDKDQVVITRYSPKDINENIPFKINTHREYETDYTRIPERTQSEIQNQSITDTGQYVVFNPAYGYLNEDAEYKGFNLQDAALYTDSDMEKLGLDDKELIVQPLTSKQQQALKLSVGELPEVQTEKLLESNSTPEFDFADFGKGLDDLDTNEPTQSQ